MNTQKELLRITADLVGFNTSSDALDPAKDRGTGEMADYIEVYLRQHGFSVHKFSYPSEYLSVAGREKASNPPEKVNLIALKGGDKPLLALSGHMDTVQVDPKKWQMTSEPFSLTAFNGKLYGRGAVDMKAFLSIAMVAGSLIDKNELAAPFALYFTSDEEIGCVGIRRLFGQMGDAGGSSDVPVPKYVVIGEPTEMKVINAHKGYMYLAVEMRGVIGHSSEPDKGRNVIELLVPAVVEQLNRTQTKLRYITDGRFEPNWPTMNQGKMYTGEDAAKNKIAGECTIEFEIRIVPGQDEQEAFWVVNEAVRAAVRKLDIKDEKVFAEVKLMRRPTPPMVTSPSVPVAQICRSLREAMSDLPRLEIPGHGYDAANYNTEGGVFNSRGAESVIWGPGNIKQAHKDDEYIEERYLSEDIVKQYVNLIKLFCRRR